MLYIKLCITKELSTSVIFKRKILFTHRVIASIVEQRLMPFKGVVGNERKTPELWFCLEKKGLIYFDDTRKV